MKSVTHDFISSQCFSFTVSHEMCVIVWIPSSVNSNFDLVSSDWLHHIMHNSWETSKKPWVCRDCENCNNDVIQYVVLHDIIISVIWSTTQSHGINASQSTRRGENNPMLNDQMPIRNRIGSIILSEWVGVLFVIFKVLDWYQIKLSMIIDCRNSSSPTNRT